jgi:hypothetical protein
LNDFANDPRGTRIASHGVKEIPMKNFGITVAFAAVIFGIPLLPALAQNENPQPKAEQPMTMGGQGMMMGGMMMMDQCKKECTAMSATMADLTKTVAASRTSQDVRTLHAAMDQVEKGLAKIDTQMKACDGMMMKMEKQEKASH